MTRSTHAVTQITQAIVSLRSHRVILDRDLADIYGVTTKRLNEQVRRNAARFPADFAFRLTHAENAALRSQNATSRAHGGRRSLPFAFTEHGAIMAATVLNSPQAVEMTVYVVRAFVELRRVVASNERLSQRLKELEAHIESKLASHDEAITAMLRAIRELMAPESPRRRGIGFAADLDDPT
jgi:hypothetical protein